MCGSVITAVRAVTQVRLNQSAATGRAAVVMRVQRRLHPVPRPPAGANVGAGADTDRRRGQRSGRLTAC